LVAGSDVLGFKELVIAEDFLLGGACRQQIQDVFDPKPVSSNTRTPPALSGLNRDAVQVEFAHDATILRRPTPSSEAIFSGHFWPNSRKQGVVRFKVVDYIGADY
jgi:hypothetical protein